MCALTIRTAAALEIIRANIQKALGKGRPVGPEETLRGIRGVYVLTDQLGAGGMAEVYLANKKGTDAQPNGQVVIKRAPRNDIGLAIYIDREAAMLKRVRHPNIVRYVDASAAFATHAKSFLAMEPMLGGSLNSLRESLTYIEWTDARDLTQSALEGVIALHTAGIVHCDLKPEAVLFSNTDNLPRITDLGLSMSIKDGAIGTIGIRGTLEFLAPERVSSWLAKYVPRSDVYQMALILFELLTGRLPYDFPAYKNPMSENARIEEIKTIHRSHMPMSLHSANSSLVVPSGVNDLMMYCLEKDPQNRPTALEMYNSLKTMG